MTAPLFAKEHSPNGGGEEERLHEVVDNQTISLQEIREHHPQLFQEVETPVGVARIFSAPPGRLIDPREGDEYNEARGGNRYTHFVEMADFTQKLAERLVIPSEQAWTPEAVLPEGVSVTEFRSKEAAEALDEIGEVDQRVGLLGFLDPLVCKRYIATDRRVAAQQMLSVDKKTTLGGGVLRAGVAATASAGYTPAEQAVFEAKRHNSLKGRKDIGIGLILPEQQIGKTQQTDTMMLREFAIATGSSLVALLLALRSRNALPQNIQLVGTVGSQASIEQVFVPMRGWFQQQGVEMSVEVGRVNTEMTDGEHPFYLAAHDAEGRMYYQVCDGGDYADIWLPPEMRRVWPGYVTEQLRENLRIQLQQKLGADFILFGMNKDMGIAFMQGIEAVLQPLEAGSELTLDAAVKARNAIVKLLGEEGRFLFGEVMTGIKYVDTRDAAWKKKE